MKIKHFITETRNNNTKSIDTVSTLEMVTLINNEDKTVAYAVEKELENIAKTIDIAYECLKNNGRIIYCGAGTSGRLGILDASECPPTFGVDFDMVQGLIAGGKEAIFKAVEHAEDNLSLCQVDLENINFSKNDILIGIAASGRTPYVIGGLMYARSIGAKTACITCNPDAEMNKHSDVSISVVVGAEAITGSTRMKAGTAQKMVLNMISTGVMIKLGKVYGNLMVDVKSTNDKLKQRALNMVMEVTNEKEDAAKNMLIQCDYDVKLTIMALLSKLSIEDSNKLLLKNDGRLAKAINDSQNI